MINKKKLLYFIITIIFCLCCILITENVSALTNYPSADTGNDRGTIISDFEILKDLVNGEDTVVITSGALPNGNSTQTYYEEDMALILDRILGYGDWDYFFINYDPNIGLNEDGINRIRFFNSAYADTSLTIYASLQSWPANTFMLYTEPATEEYFKIYDIYRVETGKWNTSSSGFRTADGGLTGMSLLSTASNFDIYSAGSNGTLIIARNEIFNVEIEPEPTPTPTPTPTPSPGEITNEKLEDIENTLTDSTLPNTDDLFGDLDISENTAISDLVTLPIIFLARSYSALSQSSCSNYILNFSFFNKPYNLSFPCIKVEKYLGSDLWTIIDLMICLFMIMNISNLFITAFEDFTSLRDSYNMLYSPKHGSGSYQGRHVAD